MNEHPLLTGRYRTRFLVVLFLVCCFNLADRAVFSVMAPLIRVDLQLTDAQIGILQGLSFALLYGGLGIPIGRLAERRSRISIIACATAFWSAATALSGMAGSYAQMLLARVGVGMGEAGFTAPTSSLVADHFPRNRRASAMSVIMLGIPIGSMTGAILAGQIAQHWTWRVAFFAFGLPGLLMGLIAWWMLKEPPRGLVEGGAPSKGPVPPLREVIAHLWRVPTLRCIVIGGAICAIGVQGVSHFLPLYLVRSFNMSVPAAAALFGLIAGVSLSIGMLTGGIGTDRASNRDPRWWVLAPAVALVLTTVCFVLGFRSPELKVAVALIGLGCMGAMIHYGPTVGLIQNLTPINMRSSAAAVFAMMYALSGAGIGPTFIGFASDAFASSQYGAGYLAQCIPGKTAEAFAAVCAASSKQGLINALCVCVLAYAVAAIFYAMAAKRLKADLNQ